MKHCTSCNETKARDDFHKSAARADGLVWNCKTCVQDKHLQRTYGLSLAEYDTMAAQQGGRCAICGTDTPTGKNGRFHVDHCHETGRVRGLLCYSCNSAIGLLKDDTAALAAAIIYLEANR